MSRSLSLVVPSGQLTLGNLLGAITHWVRDQRGTDSLYGVADLHALTTEHDPAAVRAATLDQIALLLAAGLDPARCVVFVQSHVPAHTELHWLLEATAHDGELRRMIQYKEKAARQQAVRAALLTYPVLMAADILLYGVTAVPVGDDQRQHLELARDLAIRFNTTYGETFTVPRAVTPPIGARVMDLAQPTAKMSKSAPPGAPGVIRLLDDPDTIRRRIRRATTDSGTGDGTRSPGVANLVEITAACTGTAPVEVASYRELKENCADAVIALLEPLRNRHAELVADRTALLAIVRDGAERARDLAAPVLARARAAIGLLPEGQRRTGGARCG
jgi:tryptophanyl-tRNA synthetase